MNTKQIIQKKQQGDLVLVAQMLSKKLDKYITPANAARLIERKSAKNHQNAIDALRVVVETREQILENV